MGRDREGGWEGGDSKKGKSAEETRKAKCCHQDTGLLGFKKDTILTIF